MHHKYYKCRQTWKKAGAQQKTGAVIIIIIIHAGVGDLITLENHTSAAAVTLQTLPGDTQVNSNDSITFY